MESNMWIKDVKLKDFRNYQDKKIKLHENINVFFGENAQGKTNIIEAIFLTEDAPQMQAGKDRPHSRQHLLPLRTEHSRRSQHHPGTAGAGCCGDLRERSREHVRSRLRLVHLHHGRHCQGRK